MVEVLSLHLCQGHQCVPKSVIHSVGPVSAVSAAVTLTFTIISYNHDSLASVEQLPAMQNIEASSSANDEISAQVFPC